MQTSDYRIRRCRPHYKDRALLAQVLALRSIGARIEEAVENLTKPVGRDDSEPLRTRRRDERRQRDPD
ncbi:MAG TPA: hypothetical protein VMU19_08480 [Bryobacteraceae bacterium]|nr:hypothetical protein [Bryobacteraceae bacterium]